MAEKEKVTIMWLKVDLQCHKCYKKVKRVLCKFPQIRDQTYDEKQNLVIIKVVCCSPEKIRDKLCCKGGGAIKSIEIKDPPKLKPPGIKPPPEKTLEKTNKPPPEKTPVPEKKPDGATAKPPSVTKPPVTMPVNVPPGPVPGYPPATGNPCCMDCYHGRPGGPCYSGYGAPGSAPFIQYDDYCGRPVYDSYGGGVPAGMGYCLIIISSLLILVCIILIC